MERITIDTAQLNNTTQGIGDDLSRMNAHAQQLYDAVAELNSMWKGPANAAFTSQFLTDREQLLTQLEFIADYAQSLETARSDYDNCDAWVRSTVAAIRV